MIACAEKNFAPHLHIVVNLRQVRGKVAVEFGDLGEQSLKNIGRPVRAYAVE